MVWRVDELIKFTKFLQYARKCPRDYVHKNEKSKHNLFPHGASASSRDRHWENSHTNQCVTMNCDRQKYGIIWEHLPSAYNLVGF